MKKFFQNGFFSFFSFSSKIILILLCALFVSCEYYDLPIKAYLEENSSIPYFLGYSMSVQAAATDPEGFPCIGSDEDLVVTYQISNPKNVQISLEVFFPDGSGASAQNTSVSVSEDFSSASLTVPKSVLSSVDGNTETFDISPVANLLVVKNSDDDEADVDVSTEKVDSISFSLRCNSVPTAVSNAVSMMFSDNENYLNNLVVCVELPSSDTDAKYLTVYGNSFDLENLDESPRAGWKIFKDSFTLGELSSTVTKSGYEYSNKNGGTNYYILTDIQDLLNKDLFTIGITVVDKGGLVSEECQIPSKTQRLSSPVLKHDSAEVSAGEEVAQDSGEDFASFTLEAAQNVSGENVSYIVTDSSGSEITSESFGSSVSFKLYPETDGSAKTYKVTATASAAGYVDSDEYSLEFSVSGSALSLSSNVESADENTPAEISSSGNFTYILTPSSSGNLVYSITKDGENFASSSDSENGEEISESGKSFSLGSGTYVVEAVLKKSYHKEASLKQAFTVSATQSGEISVVVPSSLKFFAEKSGSTYTIHATDGESDVTSSVSSWEISVESGGLDVTSRGFDVSTAIYSGASVTFPDDAAAGTYIIKIKAAYEGEVYSDSISLEISQ